MKDLEDNPAMGQSALMVLCGKLSRKNMLTTRRRYIQVYIWETDGWPGIWASSPEVHNNILH